MNNEINSQLQQLLTPLSQLSTDMCELLDAEHNCLKDSANEGLVAILDNKKKLSYSIEEHTRAIHKLLLTAGQNNGIYKLQQNLQSSNLDSSRLNLELWQDIERLIAKSKTLNEANGAIIELSRQHSQRALDILRGQAGASPSKTYGANGYTQNEKITRNITVA